MRIPFVKYIEALIVARIPIDEVYDRTKHLGIDLPIPALQMVYQELKKENPDYFSPSKPPPDVEWLESLNIEKMYSYLSRMSMPCGVEGIEGSIKLSEDPLMFRTITSIALAGITQEDIELILGSHFNTSYNIEDVEEFLHYFFDVKEWSLAAKQDYVENVNDAKLKEIYKLALKQEKEYVLWKLGGKPTMSLEDMLTDMATDTYYLFKEKSRKESDIAQKWGTLAVRLAEKLEKLQTKSQKADEMHAEIQFKIKQFSTSEKTKHLSELEDEEV